MLYLISDNKILGTVQNPDECPDGFTVVESDISDLLNVFYDGESIQLKPEKPEDNFNYFWNTQSNKWEIFQSKVTLEVAKQNKKAELSNKCNAFITSGFTSKALGEEYFYGSSIEDQTNLIGCVTAEISLPYVCTNPEGVKQQYLHSASEIRQVMIDGMQIKSGAIFKYRILANSIDEATTIEELEKIVW